MIRIKEAADRLGAGGTPTEEPADGVKLVQPRRRRRSSIVQVAVRGRAAVQAASGWWKSRCLCGRRTGGDTSHARLHDDGVDPSTFSTPNPMHTGRANKRD